MNHRCHADDLRTEVECSHVIERIGLAEGVVELTTEVRQVLKPVAATLTVVVGRRITSCGRVEESEITRRQEIISETLINLHITVGVCSRAEECEIGLRSRRQMSVA